MKTYTKLLGVTAAIALLSAPAFAANKHKKNVDLDGDGKVDVYMKAMPKEGNAFKILDSNGNGRVTMKEFQKNTMHDNEAEVFAMFDTDQNGYITKTELHNNSKSGGQKVNSGATSNLKTKSGQEVGSIDEKYYSVDNPFYDDPELKNDTNIDIDNPFVDDPELRGDVNWNWPKDWKFSARVNPDKPLFEQLDTNSNGVISKVEFQNNTMHDNENEVFAMLDKNQNGTISRSEVKNSSKTGGNK